MTVQLTWVPENELYEGSLLPIYLALSATSHDYSPTKSSILSSIATTLPEISDNAQIREAAVEVARAQGGELHNISSLTGGIVAQEVIKIITKQYIPIDNLCVFDGIKSKTQVFRLWDEHDDDEERWQKREIHELWLHLHV